MRDTVEDCLEGMSLDDATLARGIVAAVEGLDVRSCRDVVIVIEPESVRRVRRSDLLAELEVDGMFEVVAELAKTPKRGVIHVFMSSERGSRVQRSWLWALQSYLAAALAEQAGNTATNEGPPRGCTECTQRARTVICMGSRGYVRSPELERAEVSETAAHNPSVNAAGRLATDAEPQTRQETCPGSE
jgi:hypothetical protein